MYTNPDGGQWLPDCLDKKWEAAILSDKDGKVEL